MNIEVTPDSIDNDATITFEGPATRDNAWLSIDLGPGRPFASLNIISTDEGLVIDVYPMDYEEGAPVGSTYVFDADLLSKLLGI